MSEAFTAEVAVIGGGPAGLVAAIALATAGVDTLLIAPPVEPDHRTTALLAGSVTALASLGVWERCVPHAAPLAVFVSSTIRSGLIRGPEVCFAAAEIGLDAFGYNIENRHFIAALVARAEEMKLTRINGTALAIGAMPTLQRQACRWRGAGEACDRSRRPAFNVPERSRHRCASTGLSADSAYIQSRPRPSASRHFD